MNNKIKTMVLAVLLATSVAACKKKGDGGGGGGIGVPECDDYFARMDACAKKLDKTSGGGLTKMANMMRGAWKEDAADPEKKKGLASVCTSAIKDMAKQVPDCDWGVAPEPKPDTGSGDMTGSGSADMGSGSAAAPDGSAAAGSGSAAAPAGSGSN